VVSPSGSAVAGGIFAVGRHYTLRELVLGKVTLTICEVGCPYNSGRVLYETCIGLLQAD
jgi:hypothetical protein